MKAGLLAMGPRQGMDLQSLFSQSPPPSPSGQERARTALETGPVPDAQHPMMQHTRSVRERLAKEGLPTQASGAELHVLGERPNSFLPADTQHADSVVRSLAGPAGLGQGADVHLNNPSSRGLSPKVHAGSEALRAGKLGLDGALELGVDRLTQPIDSAREELSALRERIPNDGKTRVASMSWGQSIERVSRYLAQDAVAGGPGSALLKDANAELVKTGRPPIDLSQPNGAAKLQGYLSMRLQKATENGASKDKIATAKDSLAREVVLARRAGILPIVAAGNEGSERLFAAVPPEHHASLRLRFQSMIADVPGVLTVGASDIGKPGDLSDDLPWAYTNFGAALLAPGSQMPVGSSPMTGKQAIDLEGTSFAAPYVAGVAGLMITANPKLSVDQLDSILRDPRVLRDIPNDSRDGMGVLDEVAAVRMARDLATR